VITLEGWSYVMYNYMDAGGIFAALYFPVLVVIGGFFLLNLFLAVIMEAFSEMSSKVDDNMGELKDREGDDQNDSHEESLDEDGKVKPDKDITQMINVTKKKMGL